MSYECFESRKRRRLGDIKCWNGRADGSLRESSSIKMEQDSAWVHWVTNYR